MPEKISRDPRRGQCLKSLSDKAWRAARILLYPLHELFWHGFHLKELADQLSGSLWREGLERMYLHVALLDPDLLREDVRGARSCHKQDAFLAVESFTKSAKEGQHSFFALQSSVGLAQCERLIKKDGDLKVAKSCDKFLWRSLGGPFSRARGTGKLLSKVVHFVECPGVRKTKEEDGPETVHLKPRL